MKAVLRACFRMKPEPRCERRQVGCKERRATATMEWSPSPSDEAAGRRRRNPKGKTAHAYIRSNAQHILRGRGSF